MWLQTPENYAQFKMLTAENTNFIFNPASANESARIIIRAKPTVVNNGYPFVTGTSSWQKGMCIDITNQASAVFMFTDSTNTTMSFGTPIGTVVANTWYYFCIYYDVSSKIVYGSVYDDNGTVIWADFCAVTGALNNTSYYQKLGGEVYSDNRFKGYIDLKSVLFEIDGVPLWGAKTTAMENMGMFDAENPDNFTKLDYLQSTGTQYINAGIAGINGVDVEYALSNITDGNGVFGALKANAEKRYDIYLWSEIYLCLSSAIYSLEALDTNIHIVQHGITDNTLVVDGVNIGTTVDDVVSNELNTYIFARNRNSTLEYFRLIIKYIKLYKNGECVRFFLPVKFKCSSTIGMFDVVNNKFYRNAGTGTFGIPSDTSGEINLAEYLASLT